MDHLNSEHIAIMKHTATQAANGMYCGDSKEMQELVEEGLMRSLGRKSFCPDEYFALTGAGKQIVAKIISGEAAKTSNLQRVTCNS